MASFEISDSVKSYFNEKRRASAVDDLLEKLDGEKQPDMNWAEARNYNQALLMAMQVLADYNAMLFDLWDRTFGSVLNLRDPRFKIEFNAEYCTPSCIWDESVV